MNKRIWLLIAFFLFVSNLYSQSGWWVLYTDNELVNYQDYELNTLPHSIIYVESSLMGRFKYKKTFKYNLNNKITSVVTEKLDNNQWVSYSRNTHSYDANGNIISFLYELWNGSDWEENSRETYTYDANGNNTSYLYESRDGSNWREDYRETYTYDSNGNITTKLKQVYGSNDARLTYTYDINGNKIQEQIEDWIDNQWKNDDLYDYTYDTNGNLTVLEIKNWVEPLQDDPYWFLVRTHTYTYDANGKLTMEYKKRSTYKSSPSLRDWKETYTYNSDGSLANIQSEARVTFSIWQNQWRCSFTYDVNGKIILKLLEKWDKYNLVWFNYKRCSSSYDANGNLLSVLSEERENSGWVVENSHIRIKDSSNQFYFNSSAEEITISNANSLREAEIGEQVEYPGQFSTVTDANEVKFTKVFGKENLEIKAEIYEVKEDTIRFLLPCGLIFSNKLFLEKFKKGVTRDTVIFKITTNKGQPNEITMKDSLVWILPKLLIYDQVHPPFASGQQILPQYDLLAKYPIDVSSFFFLGASEDEMVGLRVGNTIQRKTYSPPLTLDLRVSIPGRGEVPPFQRFDEGPGDKAIQFDVKYDSIYCVCVFQEKDIAVKIPGFPAPFQIHLAGNVGNPRKIINYVPEFPRGTRQDILFNHPAPRPQQLLEYSTKKSKGAETALFKFTNYASINPNVVAVLVPPRQNPEGMPLGGAYKRAPDPKNPVSITTPTAMTDALNPTFIGSIDSLVIDFTQLPYPVPADSTSINNYWNNTVAAVIGKNTKSVSLPLANMNEIKSIICDMGSGNEIYNGNGDDFQIIVTSGTYQVAVSNTPFAETFVPFPGTFSGTQFFDLAKTSLNSARYVRITAAPNVQVETISTLNIFMDVAEQNVGPVIKTDHATMMMQRVKAFQTDINPFLQLIAQDGIMIDHNPGGFGDDTNQILTDAALINRPFSVFGYQRFLAKGYDQRPGKESFGKFHVRLETAGEWDPVDINVSNLDEKDTNPQKSGNFVNTRQRDSYLFKAEPGQRIAMNVKALSSHLNTLLELYDPEGFLIAANDDYKNRGRNSALSLNLPTRSFDSDSTLPNPSTYRIVVSALDTVAGSTIHNGITAFNRKSTGGSYELRVFTGMLIGEEVPGPAVTNCSPNGAIQGANNVEVLINGNNFVDGATVSFSGNSISVQSVNFINANQLKVKVTISQTAPIAWYDVTITNPNGGKKTMQHFFEVRSSFGMVNLNWQAPQIGETLNAPTNLTSNISGQQTMAKKITIRQNKNKTLFKSSLNNKIRNIRIQSALDDFITEVEPNNDFSQAQQVRGDSSIWIDGQAETADTGPVTFEYFEGIDDVEDWFKFNSQGDYLDIILYGFTSDCDLFLFASPDSSGLVDYSITADDTTEEYLFIDQPPAGTYYVGVSIFDQAGIDDTTFYYLDLYGNFGSSTSKRLKSYNVYRSHTPNAKNTGTKIASVDSNTTSFQDNPPTKRKYYYQVTAVYDQGESEPSNEASVTITKVDDETILPDNFVLYQNYPNPFNPTTEIKYSTPETNTFIKLIVYDISGNEIKTLVNERKNPGIYTIKWNGRNSEGVKVASGLYFYRIQVGSYSDVQKMLLLK